ncbi:GOLPH3/VPS74 family protein [Crossiella sp. CA198]|uniref:GOLPH3/VPS74 family protein n=1 Tax=Crossiella sp. CA198 TaxID=3455607 RepID=UPI003F8D5EA4
MPTNDAPSALVDDFALLLLTEDGQFATRRSLDGLFAVALLIELAQLERLELFGEDNRLFVTDDSDTGVPALNEALAALEEHKGSVVKEAIARLSTGQKDRVLGRLVAEGAVESRTERRKLIFSSTSWHLVDTARRNKIHADIKAVLFGAEDPAEQDELIVGLLSAAALVKIVAGRSKTAKQIAEKVWERYPVAGVVIDLGVQGVPEGIIPPI